MTMWIISKIEKRIEEKIEEAEGNIKRSVKFNLEEMVISAIRVVLGLTPDPDRSWPFRWSGYDKAGLSKVINDAVGVMVKKEVKNYMIAQGSVINSEEFIDKIIDRINRKQISKGK